jgi:hypothetical protein
MITGKTNTGGFYNPTLSYVGTPWSNASYINVTFKLMGEDVSTNKFEIYNGNTNELDSTCTNISANSCTSRMSVTGSYYVIAYNGSEKVGNRKYFNIKIDNTPPTFDIKDQEQEKDLGDGYEFSYNNEVINIHDDNGYKSAVFSLKELVDTNPSVNIVNKDLTASNLQILETLPSGKYRLMVTVTDYAKNSTSKSIEFTIKYNVDMVYFDNTETRHDMGAIRVYTNGFYDGLLTQVTINGDSKTADWYDNTNFDAHGEPKYDFSRKVTKTSRHTLYGREKRDVIDPTTEPHCNNGNNFTYNASDQELVTAQPGYHVTNNVQKNAGTYIIIAMPDENFTWADNTRTYKMIQCTIKRYEIIKPVDACQPNLIYNGNDQTLVKQTFIDNNKTSFGYKAYNIDPLTGQNAGDYDVAFSLWDLNNYIWSDGSITDKSFTCNIAKYSISAPPNPCRSGLVYNGMIQKLVDYSGDNNVNPTNPPMVSSPPTYSGKLPLYYVRGWYGQRAGDYPVTYRIIDTKNFQWSDGTTADKVYTCSIAKYQAEIPANPCATDLEYNKKDQSLLSSSAPTSPKLEDGNAVWYHGGDLTGKNAGNYKTTIYLRPPKDSVEWSDGTTAAKEFTCKIAKAPVTWTTDRTLIYTGYNAREQVLVLTMISALGDHISLRLVPTTVSSDHVYSANVNFSPGSHGADTYASNYYITNPTTTIGFTNDSVTITAGSSQKEYDGEPLTDATFKESGSIASNGDTLTSVTNTGSQTDPGTSDNTPSAAVINYGGINTTGYYNITYKKGELKVVDTTPPTCSVSVSEAGVLSATVSDNYKLWTYGWDNYWHARSTTKTITEAGKYTFLVRDTSDNRTFCYITVTKVKQKRTITCKTYESCATSGCGCDKYKSCATSECGCDAYNSCATSGCGCKTYNSCETSGCGCKTYKSCATSGCGCKTYKTCEDSSCGCKTYKSCAHSDCGCLFTLFGVCFPKTCATSACGCKTYNSCEDSDCGCKTYKTCENSACGCKTYNTCENSACGCNTYNTCADSACGCKTNKTCENSACGCDTYTTCENNACGCKTWNTPGSWSDDKNCSEGEASDHKSKTECQEIFRGS